MRWCGKCAPSAEWNIIFLYKPIDLVLTEIEILAHEWDMIAIENPKNRESHSGLVL